MFTHGDECFEGVCYGTEHPSIIPSEIPSEAPSTIPTHHSSAMPSVSPSGFPSTIPTPSPVSPCTFPDQVEWLIIATATDWCTDRRAFGINEEITLVYYNGNIDHESVDKIEIEFRAGTDERKTKYKLQGDWAIEKGQTDLSLGLPRKFEDGTYRLTILMGDIGSLGGWDSKNGDFTANDPDGAIIPGETATYKFKVEDRNDRYQIESSNADELIATEATILSTVSPSPSVGPSNEPSSVPS